MRSMRAKGKRESNSKSPPPGPRRSIPQIESEREEQIRLGLEGRRPKTPLRSLKGLPCPVCETGALVVVDSLTVDWVQNGERIVVGNLTGFRCSSCGREFYDAQSSRIISRYIDKARPRGGYSATISSLGGGKLGVYFPRDLLRNIDFAKSEVVRLYPVSRKKIVIESAETTAP